MFPICPQRPEYTAYSISLLCPRVTSTLGDISMVAKYKLVKLVGINLFSFRNLVEISWLIPLLSFCLSKENAEVSHNNIM